MTDSTVFVPLWIAVVTSGTSIVMAVLNKRTDTKRHNQNLVKFDEVTESNNTNGEMQELREDVAAVATALGRIERKVDELATNHS